MTSVDVEAGPGPSSCNPRHKRSWRWTSSPPTCRTAITGHHHRRPPVINTTRRVGPGKIDSRSARRATPQDCRQADGRDVNVYPTDSSRNGPRCQRRKAESRPSSPLASGSAGPPNCRCIQSNALNAKSTYASNSTSVSVGTEGISRTGSSSLNAVPCARASSTPSATIRCVAMRCRGPARSGTASRSGPCGGARGRSPRHAGSATPWRRRSGGRA